MVLSIGRVPSSLQGPITFILLHFTSFYFTLWPLQSLKMGPAPPVTYSKPALLLARPHTNFCSLNQGPYSPTIVKLSRHALAGLTYMNTAPLFAVSAVSFICSNSLRDTSLATWHKSLSTSWPCWDMRGMLAASDMIQLMSLLLRA